VRFLGRRRPQQSWVQALADAARREVGAGTARETVRGQLEGLTTPLTQRARLRAGEDETVTHHAGYLLGRFLTWVESTGRVVDDDLVMVAAAYFATLAASLDAGRWDPADPRLPGHTPAMVVVERKRAEPVPVATESLLVSWLTAHAGLKPLGSAAATLGDRRRRRHARLFPGPEAPERPA
jgi:hypothetical protein